MITDTHAHYDDEAFESDRDALLLSLQENGIGRLINVGASMRGCRDSYRLSMQYPFVYAALGVHPSETEQLTEEDMQWILQTAKDPKVVAIGEIGLDYHFPDDPPPEHQKQWFARQIALAKEAGLPLIIHSRDAERDTAAVLADEHAEECGGVMHCYSYSKESARDFLNLGLYFGIGGVLTFKNGRKLKEAAAFLPMDRILLETDCPYLAPEPYRGKRNCSLYLPYVVEELARIKKISEEEVIRITTENAKRLFALPD
ncbi:MAG: TatD family hydrolase [Lachnospiraceae bacterium]|nr:TatD family hydrolase [Lachnospiraceae bacterium]